MSRGRRKAGGYELSQAPGCGPKRVASSDKDQSGPSTVHFWPRSIGLVDRVVERAQVIPVP